MQTNVLKAEIVGRVFKNRAVNLQREKKREKETWRVGLVHQPRPTALTPPGDTEGPGLDQHQLGLGTEARPRGPVTPTAAARSSQLLCSSGSTSGGHSQGWGEDPSANGAELGGTQHGEGTDSSHSWGSLLGSLLLQMAISASLGAAVQAECGQRMGP